MGIEGIKRKSKKSVLVSIASDVLVAITKTFVAIISGSSAMASEAIHTAVDSMNGIFLLIGSKKSQRPMDAGHPLGYGRELYFWTLVAALSIFALGGGMSIYEGVNHLLNPHPIGDAIWNYIVLGISAIFECVAIWSAWVEYRDEKRREHGFWETFVASKDLTTFAVLFENSAALVGVLLALAGVYLSERWNSPWPDGVASILIGFTLVTVAFFLLRESKGLLIGESTNPKATQEIRRITEQNPDVEEILSLLSLQLGAHEVLIGMDIRFRSDLNTSQVVNVIDDLERSIRERFPDVVKIFIEADRLIERQNKTA